MVLSAVLYSGKLICAQNFIFCSEFLKDFEKIDIVLTLLEAFPRYDARKLVMPMNSLSIRVKISIFAVLLVVLIALAALFGSGVLRFGLEGPFVYIIYVIAGLLVAFVCFGLLDSSGELTGNPLSTNVKLGGAIVGLVVVIAGGALYEIYGRPQQTFSTRVAFYTSNGEIVKPKGTLTLFIGAGTQSATIDSGGTALFQNIPAAWRSKEAQCSLESQEYRPIAGSNGKLLLKPEETVPFLVEHKPLFSSYEHGKIDFEWKSGESVQLAASANRDLTIRLIATAESELPLPIRSKGSIMFLRQGRPIPVKTIDADVGTETSDDVVILQPNQPTTLIFSALLSPDLVSLASKRDLIVRFKVFYRESTGSVLREYISPDFPLDKATVSFDR